MQQEISSHRRQANLLPWSNVKSLRVNKAYHSILG
jgi:hypothetical protein